MYSLYQLTLNECLKLTKKRSFFIPFLIMVIVSLGFALVLKKFMQGEFGFSGFMEMLVSIQGAGSIYTFLCLISMASLISSEYQLGTIKLLLIRSHSRHKILASKYVALLLYIVILMAFTLIAGTIISLLVFGSGGEADIAGILKASGYTLLYSWIYATIVFMLSTLTKSTGATIGIAFVLIFMEDLIVMLLSRYDIAKFLLFFNTNLQMYEEGTPIIEGMSLGFSIAVILVYIIAFLGTAFYVFKKRDVA